MEQTHRHQFMKPEFILVVLLSLASVFYAGYRASTLSMTMDESGTFINHVPKPINHILTNEPIPDGNNHILNTLLIKASVAIFGANSFSVRLPNVFALGLYLFFGLRILLLLKYRPGFLLVGWALLLLNPYLIDFFSLGRGYGLANGFMLGSLYCWFCFLGRSKRKHLIGAFAFAILAVYANFIWLNFFYGTIGLLWLVVDQTTNSTKKMATKMVGNTYSCHCFFDLHHLCAFKQIAKQWVIFQRLLGKPGFLEGHHSKAHE